ncbi:MAG: glycosyltransferase, partial [Chloroflexi bacterium]|nr:glycosyltransferase [Chloroflexota bacterium]
MISVVLYGRNDSHGYNLHKRATISLNCIAEGLTHPGDEIIFVDCNTPDDMPTFPEAIQDTLTPRARHLLRVLRLRPALFERHKRGTPLPVSEPLCRNIAIRRANPANRWILSTNTDMVFVPQVPGRSLSDAAAAAPDGFYGLPRFEVPETLWESLDRTDPAAIIAAFRRWGPRLHLNEAIYLEPFIRFDGPGDFQLVLREQICAIHGFNEEMVLGFHVDSNLCKRLYLLNGRIDSLVDEVHAYHCDHTRRATLYHRVDFLANDPQRFVHDVASPHLPEQADVWGLPDAEIEELRLDDAYLRRLERVLEALLPGQKQAMLETLLVGNWWNRDVFYDTAHVFPFLADHLTTLPASATIGYVGANAELLGLLAAARAALGHTGRLLVARDVFAAAWPQGEAPLPAACVPLRIAELADQADVIVFDLGMHRFPRTAGPSGGALVETPEALAYIEHVRAAFLVCTAHERARLRAGGAVPRKLFFIGGQGTWFEELAAQVIGVVLTPFSTHVRHGYLRTEAPAASGPGVPIAVRAVDLASPTAAAEAAAPAERPATAAPADAPRADGCGAAGSAPAAPLPVRRLRSAQLRVALVAPGPPRGPMGIEHYTALVADELRRRGHAVRLIWPERDPRRPAGLVREHVHEGLAVTLLNVLSVETRGDDLANGPVATAFGRHLAGFDLDVVHFHDLSALSVAALQSCRELGLRTVVTAHDAWLLCEQRHLVHGDGSYCARGPESVERCAACAAARHPAWSLLGGDRAYALDFFRRRSELLRACLGAVDLLVAASDTLRRAFAAHGLEHPRVVVAPPGLAPLELARRLPGDGRVSFTYLGELTAAMGADLALRAVAELRPGTARLDLYGGVPDFRTFQRVMASVPQDAAVSYCGLLADADLPEVLARTDVAVLPARPTGYTALVGYPGLIRRCLQAGVPVIAPNLGVIPELVRDGVNGLLLRPGDADDLAAKLRRFADAPERVAAFRQCIAPQRTLAEDADALEALYDEVMASAPAQPQAAELPARAATRLGPGE